MNESNVIPIRKQPEGKEELMRGRHWRCICGAVAMPLTDDTPCECGDIYEQEWSLYDGDVLVLDDAEGCCK